MSSWLVHLRQSHPTFLFRSASAYLPVDPHAAPAKSKVKVSNTDALGRDVLLEALHAIAESKKLPELTIAIIGVTNVSPTSWYCCSAV
jgi:nuclear GTP-binding protein